MALEQKAWVEFNSIILFGLYCDVVITLLCNNICKTMCAVTIIRLKGLVTMPLWLNSLTRYNYPCRNQMNSSEKLFCLSFYYAVLLQVCDTWQSYLSKYFLLSNLLLRKYAYTVICCYQCWILVQNDSPTVFDCQVYLYNFLPPMILYWNVLN